MIKNPSINITFITSYDVIENDALSSKIFLKFLKFLKSP